MDLPTGITPALIDTGSEVTCISEELWQELRGIKALIPALPVTAIQLRGAMGQRSMRVTTQVALPSRIAGCAININCLVVSKLIRLLILGSDWLAATQGSVCYDNKMLTFYNDNQRTQVPFPEVPHEERLTLVLQEPSEPYNQITYDQTADDLEDPATIK